MDLNYRIPRALLSAWNHIEKSILALKNSDETAFSSDIWHVAAELEYALFLFSLMLGDEQKMQITKPNPEKKTPQTDNALMLKAKELIEGAQNFLENGDSSNAYKSAYLARHYVFKVQESLNKKKHGASR